MIVRKKTVVLLSRNINTVLARQSLQFTIQLKKMTDEETKEYHRKKLYELSIKSLGEIPQIHEPTDEQKEWVLDRLKQPTKYWQRWFVSQYFTREQKAVMGLTDKDIAGKGIK